MDNSKKILIIEDEKQLQEAILTKFHTLGLTPKAFESGSEALHFLQGHTEIPDGIWLDYYLKDLNGIEFMTELKKDPQLASIPVLVVSNSANSDKIHQLLELGVKDYVLKAEYKLDDIIKKIFEIIDKKEQKSPSLGDAAV